MDVQLAELTCFIVIETSGSPLNHHLLISAEWASSLEAARMATPRERTNEIRYPALLRLRGGARTVASTRPINASSSSSEAKWVL